MNAKTYDDIAWIIHREIKPLRPLQFPAHVDLFNTLRTVSAKLVAIFVEHDPTFDPERFMSIAMNGKAT